MVEDKTNLQGDFHHRTFPLGLLINQYKEILLIKFFKLISSGLYRFNIYVSHFINLFFKDFLTKTILKGGFPGGSDCKESACNSGNLSLIPVEGNDQVAQIVKNLTIMQETGWIPGSGSCPGEGHDNHSNTHSWRISRTEGSDRLQATESDTTEATQHNTCIFKVFIKFVIILFLQFMFQFFGSEACGILAPRPGIELHPLY